MTIQFEPLKPSAKNWTPWPYQEKGVKWLLEHACAALFADPGAGKTTCTLATLKILKKKKMINKVLLIAPILPCYDVWPKEIKKWADFNHFTYEILHGPDKDNALKREADIYLINPEGLDWLLQTEKSKNSRGKTQAVVDRKRFKALGFDVLVIDELTKFKNYTSDRFKALSHVLDTFSRRYGLTGSPTANGLIQLFGQCYVLDMGRSLGRYITHYRASYFNPPVYGFKWTIKEGADQQIYERIAPLALRLDPGDLLKLPQLIENNIYVDLPPKVQEIYDALENDLLANILGDRDVKRTVTAANSGVAIGKCRQITSGGIYHDPLLDSLGLRIPKQARTWETLHDQKTNALLDLSEELQGSPLLVAYEFGHALDRLRKAFNKKDYPDAVFVADYPKSQFSKLSDRWNRGEISHLIGHAAPLAFGLNLQEAGNHVAWYDIPYDYEVYDQYIRRVLRQGNKHKRVFVHHFMVRDSIDEVVLYGCLKKKAKNQQALFSALLELASSRRKKKTSTQK